MLKRSFTLFTIIATFSLCLTSCDDDDDESVTPSDYDTDTYAVDLGLSVKWATINIGASLPADYGNYYAWGEIETKTKYLTSNSTTYGILVTDDIAGDAEYDAAAAIWLGKWRMPTADEFQELIDNCTWKWTTQTNSDNETITGYKITSSNSKSIFLPAAANFVADNDDAGENGQYWSASSDFEWPIQADALMFESDTIYVKARLRYAGAPIRPVIE